MRGAIVQLIQDIGFVFPNIISFQYNPAKVTRGLKPWNPFDTDATKKVATATQAAPFDPEETYQFTLEFDATNDIELKNPIAIATGVASRIAAVQKLVMPTAGLIGDLVGAAKALAGQGQPGDGRGQEAAAGAVRARPGADPAGAGHLDLDRGQGVQFAALSADGGRHARPARAHPRGVQVQDHRRGDFAKSAYEFTRLQEDALAIANISNALLDARSMLPLSF
jgi:hypothetical protein